MRIFLTLFSCASHDVVDDGVPRGLDPLPGAHERDHLVERRVALRLLQGGGPVKEAPTNKIQF